jgi:hypothetical protein
MTEDLVYVHFNGRAWEWLWKWTTDSGIRSALSKARKEVWADGRGFRAHVALTRPQANKVIRQLEEWEDLRISGTLPKDPTDYDIHLFNRARRHILECLGTPVQASG